jgi:hypothetical protein
MFVLPLACGKQNTNAEAEHRPTRSKHICPTDIKPTRSRHTGTPPFARVLGPAGGAAALPLFIALARSEKRWRISASAFQASAAVPGPLNSRRKRSHPLRGGGGVSSALGWTGCCVLGGGVLERLLRGVTPPQSGASLLLFADFPGRAGGWSPGGLSPWFAVSVVLGWLGVALSLQGRFEGAGLPLEGCLRFDTPFFLVGVVVGCALASKIVCSDSSSYVKPATSTVWPANTSPQTRRE